MEVVWTQRATADVCEICDRLDDWEEGVGDRFYLDLMQKANLLQANPGIGPVYHGGNIRRLLVFNRNYGLFYILEPRGIIVHTVQDLRQDPAAIRRRLRNISPAP